MGPSQETQGPGCDTLWAHSPHLPCLFVQLEVTVDSMADLEQLWAAIPADMHAAWSQRARTLLIDGSPRWDVLRTCPVLPDSATGAQAAVAPAVSAQSRASPSGRPLRVPRGVNPWKTGGATQVCMSSKLVVCGLALKG